MASYLDAKKNNGKWLLRIEDIDQPRVEQGAANAIIHDLKAYGFAWDEDISYQSQQLDRYQEALNQLITLNKVYRCRCSRSTLNETAKQGTYGLIYPRTCLDLFIAENEQASWRLKTNDEQVVIKDSIQTPLSCNAQQDLGDFVIKRADEVFAYHLASVLDDYHSKVTHVVRGSDLYDSSMRHRILQRALGLPTVNYAHHPVVVNSNGQKLSKQNLAPALKSHNALNELMNAWHFLQRSTLETDSIENFWEQALQQWDMNNIPRVLSINEND